MGKHTDGKVFCAWSQAECEECGCMSFITRCTSKTVFGRVLCSSCKDMEVQASAVDNAYDKGYKQALADIRNKGGKQS